MARAGAVGEWGRRISRRFSYKKIIIAVCSLNLLAALIVLKSLYASFSDLAPPGRPASLSAVKYTEEQIRRIEEAIRVRQAAEPVELVNLVKKLRKELEGAKRRWELSDSVKQETANDILRRLRGLNETEVTEQRGYQKPQDADL